MYDSFATAEEQHMTPQFFRSVMGSFPTGVTVVTTTSGDGDPVGMTVNAITSVSLDPPQLLICLAKSRYTAAAIRLNGAFVVNFLGEDQKGIASTFASNIATKFNEVSTHKGRLGIPMISDSLALAECEVRDVIDANDHMIFIGEVVGGKAGDGMPLVFFRRNYGTWAAV
jgi:flavin reductase (DIM6/NTAB) family NADH-FMN oxidoreductase RutF